MPKLRLQKSLFLHLLIFDDNKLIFKVMATPGEFENIDTTVKKVVKKPATSKVPLDQYIEVFSL